MREGDGTAAAVREGGRRSGPDAPPRSCVCVCPPSGLQDQQVTNHPPLLLPFTLSPSLHGQCSQLCICSHPNPPLFLRLSLTAGSSTPPGQAMLLIWRPSEELLSLKDGDVALVSSLVPTRQAWAELGPALLATLGGGPPSRSCAIELSPSKHSRRGRAGSTELKLLYLM